ncbi:uncharacterized protein [Henckelia pumila]|uniref:uncharacterized protein n=1 Tax=Henckelia pumila TaxID=405737 RepID=UPI003C6DC2D5
MDHRISRGIRPTDPRGIRHRNLRDIRPRDPLLPRLGRSLLVQFAARPTLAGACWELEYATGRILVAGVANKALLDSGATHSFISEAFVHKWGIQREELSVGFSVIIPSGEELTTKSLVRILELLLQGQMVVADLIVFPMPEFDLILGMDWMVKNAVVIDFQQRSVLVRPEGVEPFWFEAAKSRRKAKVISFLQARQFMLEGCETFLESLTLAEMPIRPVITDVDVVLDF